MPAQSLQPKKFFVLFVSFVSFVSFVFSEGCAREPAPRWIEPATQMEFVLVPAGEFVAGSPATETGHQDDEVLYPVRMARPFYVAAHEVTVGQWAAVMQRDAPILDEGAGSLPMVNVTWHDAREFLDKLNHGKPWRLRLPSEVEWEYACRSGTTTPYSTGSSLSTSQANYNGEFPLPGQPTGENRRRVTPVGSFAPNAWGLFDMHGNVWEWTNDAYDETRKVIRGGSWRFNADSARCALRYTHRPQDRGDSLGLRLVRDMTKDESDE
jgi:formylglycine-generating enzyme required for sulfatase activity